MTEQPVTTTLPRIRVMIRGDVPIVELLHRYDDRYYYGLPYADVLAMWAYYKQVVRSKRYAKSRFSCTKLFGGRWLRVMRTAVYVGCQRFTHTEIRAFAKQQGWAPLPKRVR